METVMSDVLVVDDSPVMLQMIDFHLNSFGFQTKLIEDPLLVMDVISKRSFDLLLLDIHMPGIDGLELLLKIEQEVSVPGQELRRPMDAVEEVVCVQLRVRRDDAVVIQLVESNCEAIKCGAIRCEIDEVDPAMHIYPLSPWSS